jgi:hypothetical protein
MTALGLFVQSSIRGGGRLAFCAVLGCHLDRITSSRNGLRIVASVVGSNMYSLESWTAKSLAAK